MNLSWANLRTLSGSQQAAFEELCRQLARSETPVDDRFVPKGSPDAGVECLYTLPNGDEWGWQAKFFESSLTSAQWNQLDRSVKKALDSHPKLARYFVCVPRNRADGRRSGIKTELQRWDERVEKWSGWAFDLGMEVKFNWWGSSELWERLSLQEQAGKRAFWFGNPELYTNRWFRNRLDEAVASAGARYSPELHVDLPIAQSFELFGRTSAAATSVHRLAKDIRGACSYEIRRIATEESLDRLTSLKPVVDTCNEIAGACDEIVGALADGQCPPHQQWNIADICEAIKTALGLIDSSQEAVASAPRDYEESNPKGETGHARSSNPFRSAASALRYLESQLWATLSELRAIEPIINSDLLIVTGEAGTGKTHLLCDVAENRIGQGLPTVILMGQRFLSAEAPWGQALAQLDLANSSADEFIGALEAAAQAADSRALFIIDAINEGEGDVIWPAHLSPLLEQLRRSPWIATVLSVRTPYLERVVPAEVFQSAHVLEHHGFAESTYAAVRRYCEQFDLEFPTTPLLRPEFDNPLFLKTMCEGLRSTGQRRFPVGSEGITRIFDRYLDGINTRLADQLDLDPQARTVHRALEILVKRFSERRARWLPRNEAQSLVDELAPNRAYSRSLYRALVDSGVLMEVLPSSLEGNPVVQFGFEWFADHLIAVGLIDSHEDTESLARELAPWDAPGIATRRPLMSGLLDALAILLPERHRAELPDVYTGDLAAWSAMQSFLKTLPWRDPNTIGPRCHALVDDAFDSLNGEHEWPLLIDSLVTCATIPKHPVGAESFDDRLRQLPMPDRDAVWSTYLHYAYDEDGPVDRLLDWAESLHPTDANIDPESARACAVVLAWFLTASNRFVRDRATKCLVALLHENCDLATELVRRFHDVDDPYVVERVIAAAYGIAMRSADAQGLGSLATVVYENVFAASNPPVHFLTRDYARGVIERALYLGSPIDIDRSKIEPPYPSAWPDIPDDAELERIDPRETGTTGTEYARSLIRTSVMHWDFSRYIIGTNSTDVSHTWLSVPLDEPRWKSCDEQLEDFLTWLGDDLGETFRSLIKRNPRSMRSALLARGQARTSQEETEEIISAFVVKPWVADTGFDQICLKMLKDEQRRRYHELMALRDTGEPRLSLDIIQRYVLWRTYDLGWTVDRFGYFDRRVSGGRSLQTQKPERIGKKYQWIAYHEILAYISDHYQYRDQYSDIQAPNVYQGPWQLYRRDIDPSVVSCSSGANQEHILDSNRWWECNVPIPTTESTNNLDWAKRTDDIPGRDAQLYFSNDTAGTRWLKLHSMDTWKMSLDRGYDEHELDYRELWLEARGYFIPSGTVDEFLGWAKQVNFWNQWLPDPPGDSGLFFGELGWSKPYRQVLDRSLDSQFPEPLEGGPISPVPLSSLAYSYLAGASQYDCSLERQIPFLRPSSRLVESLNLHWTGIGANFANSDGVVVAFDPSIYDEEHSALMIREDCLQQHLTDTNSELVWAIIGEKRVRNPGDWGNTWAAFLELTGAYAHGIDNPLGHISTKLQVVDRR